MPLVNPAPRDFPSVDEHHWDRVPERGKEARIQFDVDLFDSEGLIDSQVIEELADLFAQMAARLRIQRNRHRAALPGPTRGSRAWDPVFRSTSRAICAAAARGSGAAVMGRPTTR